MWTYPFLTISLACITTIKAAVLPTTKPAAPDPITLASPRTHTKVWPPYTYILSDLQSPYQDLSIWDALSTACQITLQQSQTKYAKRPTAPYPGGYFSCSEPAYGNTFVLQRLLNEPTWHMTYAQVGEVLMNLTETVQEFGEGKVPTFNLNVYMGAMPMGDKVANGAWGPPALIEGLLQDGVVAGVTIE